MTVVSIKDCSASGVNACRISECGRVSHFVLEGRDQTLRGQSREQVVSVERWPRLTCDGPRFGER